MNPSVCLYYNYLYYGSFCFFSFLKLFPICLKLSSLQGALIYTMRTFLSFIIIVSVCNAQSFLDIIGRYVRPTRQDFEFMQNIKYDFIIVGAGSGGSVLANRLSEDKRWRVLLLEAGYEQNIFNEIPILVGYFQLSNYNWKYKVEPQKNACLGMIDHQCNWPRGKSMGGTSTLNYMIHTRGNKLDYDKWASLGNIGWSYEEVLQYFKKSEKFNIPGKSLLLLNS